MRSSFVLLGLLLASQICSAAKSGSIKVRVRFDDDSIISKKERIEVFKQLRVRAYKKLVSAEIEEKDETTAPYELYSLRTPSFSMFRNWLRRWRTAFMGGSDSEEEEKKEKPADIHGDDEYINENANHFKMIYDYETKTFTLRSKDGKYSSKEIEAEDRNRERGDEDEEDNEVLNTSDFEEPTTEPSDYFDGTTEGLDTADQPGTSKTNRMELENSLKNDTEGLFEVTSPLPNETDSANATEAELLSEVVELDVEGHVGPNYEVSVTGEAVRGERQIERVHTWRIDQGVMEREEYAITVAGDEAEVWRAQLTNFSLLEQVPVDAHRDYGSSYILPVLSSVNYDNTTAPVAFSDIPVSVAVAFNVLYLANFDSQLMEFSIDVEMEFSWFDKRLVNNYTKPIRIREKPIIELIWRPDPYIVNSKYSYLHYVSFPNVRMRITPQGLVTYTMRVSSVCNCFMRFCLYPHDRQTCDMKISSIAYSREYVRFHWHSTPVRFQSKITLPELHITSIDTQMCNIDGKLLNSSCLRLIFALERDSARFVVEKYIPSTLAMMFAWVAPYVPYNYEEVRIITPITVLLTLVQMEKGDKEIRTSYLTSIDVWFAAMKSFTVLSLLESLAVLALIKRSRAMDKNAQRAANEFERSTFQSESRRLNRFYHRLDSVCRFVSPAVFVVFFVYYVLFIAQGEEDCVPLTA